MESIRVDVVITFDDNDIEVRNKIDNLIKNHKLSQKVSELLINDLKSNN